MNIRFVEREMTQAEFERMNAGFDQHTIEQNNPIQTSERYGFVVTDADLFVGCASGLAYKNGAKFNPWFYLSDLFIEKNYRGQGFGSTLLSKLEARVAALGIEHISSRTTPRTGT